ncbi:MAG: hypothetical protein RIS10_613, partial [Pseudomonadota bacterium]
EALMQVLKSLSRGEDLGRLNASRIRADQGDGTATSHSLDLHIGVENRQPMTDKVETNF